MYDEEHGEAIERLVEAAIRPVASVLMANRFEMSGGDYGTMTDFVYRARIAGLGNLMRRADQRKMREWVLDILALGWPDSRYKNLYVRGWQAAVRLINHLDEILQ
jgi:hypothetical protein